jgi:hypothetical protein
MTHSRNPRYCALCPASSHLRIGPYLLLFQVLLSHLTTRPKRNFLPATGFKPM